MHKLILLLVMVLFLCIGVTPDVFAVENCQPIFGGGKTCLEEADVTIDKKIWNPLTKTFVDTIGSETHSFSPSQEVRIQLIVTNRTGNSLSNVSIKDILPKSLSYVSGGKIDSSQKVVTFDLSELKAREVKTYEIKTRVVSDNQLSSTLQCFVNYAEVSVKEKISDDNALFCVSKNQNSPSNASSPRTQTIFPPPQVSNSPSTGPSELALLAMVPTGFMGIFLRKLAKR